MPRYAWQFLFVFPTILLVGCNNTSNSGFAAQESLVGFAEWQIGPLSISIDSNGDVDLTVGPEFRLPTPLGTIRIGAGTGFNSSAERFKDVDGGLLIIRINNQEDHVFNLWGQNFDVSFAPGQYEGIRIAKDGENLYIDIYTNGVNPNYPSMAFSTQTPIPLSANQPNSICSGAPPTQLAIGAVVQVDFNSVGALRIMTDPYGTNEREDRSKTIVLAYDNDRLEILDGPVCSWNGDRLLWKVYYHRKGVEGWAPEGIMGDYWMCPINTPECGS